MEFEKNFLKIEEGELKLFEGMPIENNRIPIGEFKKLIAPIANYPAFVLKDPYKISTQNRNHPIGYTPHYVPDKSGSYCFVASNKFTNGLTYDQLYIMAFETGILQEQIKPNEGNSFESTAGYNKASEDFIISSEVVNSYKNYKTIIDYFAVEKKGNIEPGSANCPCVVIGSGSSLNDFIPYLGSWIRPVICTASHFNIINYHTTDSAIIHTLVLDARTKKAQFDYRATSNLFKNSIITHPGVLPEILTIPVDKYFFRCTTPNKALTAPIDAAYDFIKTEIPMFSCSISAQIAIAQIMGYSPIYLVGCDLSAERFTDIEFSAEKMQFVDKHYPLPDERQIVTADNGVKTERIQLFYKRSVLMQILASNAPVINCSKKSIITEIPYLSMERISHKQHEKKPTAAIPTERELIERIEPYLAKNNTYMIRSGSPGHYGKRFVEIQGGAEGAIAWLYKNNPAGVDIKKHSEHLLWLDGRGKSPFIEELKK
jgi:hypothetical protein